MQNSAQPAFPAEIASAAAQHNLGSLQSIYRLSASIVLSIILVFLACNAIAIGLVFLGFSTLTAIGMSRGILVFLALLESGFFLVTPVLSLIYLMRFLSSLSSPIYVCERGLLFATRPPEVVQWEHIQGFEARKSPLEKTTTFATNRPVIFLTGLLGSVLLLLACALVWPLAVLIGTPYLLRHDDGRTYAIDGSRGNGQALQERIKQGIASVLLANAITLYDVQHSVSFGRLSVNQDSLVLQGISLQGIGTSTKSIWQEKNAQQDLNAWQEKLGAVGSISWQEIQRLELNEKGNTLTITRYSGAPAQWMLGGVPDANVAVALANRILSSRSPSA